MKLVHVDRVKNTNIAMEKLGNFKLKESVVDERITVLSVDKLRLRHFRNHSDLTLDFAPALVVITGENGAGKTNILEAISLLAPGRGLRNAKLCAMINQRQNEPQGWCIDAIINSLYGHTEVTTNLASNSSSTGKRVVKTNDRAIRSHTELSKLFGVIWLTPQMDPIFIASSSLRRRFLDRLVYNFDPEHASRMVIYENAMRQRLKLLREGRCDDVWLNALEHNMAENAVAIAHSRVQTVEYLQEAIYSSGGEFPQARLTLAGEIEEMVPQMAALQVEEIYTKKLKELRKLDMHSGRTNAGIHRSDLLVYHLGKNTEAALCSTGEQKALLISIILAEAKAKIKWHSSVPVLLLDEVVAHLDEPRREALLAELADLKAQCFITATDNKIFSSNANMAQFYQI